LQNVHSAVSEYAAPLLKRNGRIIIGRPLRGSLRGLLRGPLRCHTARVWLNFGDIDYSSRCVSLFVVRAFLAAV
jgi:hypothetical protein